MAAVPLAGALLASSLLVATGNGTVARADTAAPAAAAVAASAAAEDDLAVVQVGDPATPLPTDQSIALPVSVVRMDGDGVANGDPWVLPTVADSENGALTLPQQGDGPMTLSTDGQFLALGGFAQRPVGESVLTGTFQQKTIARLDGGGGVDTSTVVDNLYPGMGASIQEIATVDGGRYWTVGTGQPLHTIAHGSGVYTQIFSRIGAIAIGGGQLYASTASAIVPVGDGVPTVPVAAAGPPIISLTNGGGGSGTFTLLDRDPDVPGVDTFYGLMGLGIRKFTKGADGVWVRRGDVVPAPGPFTSMHVIAKVAGDQVRIYVTPPGGRQIIRITDVSDPHETFSAPDGPVVIADAPANTVFRGIAFAPTGDGPPPAADDDLAVVQVGDGAIPWPEDPRVALPVSVRRIDGTGVANGDPWIIPTEASGRNAALTLSSQGQGKLDRSADGRLLTFGGFGARPVGSRTDQGTFEPKTIARLDSQGGVSTRTAVTNLFSVAGALVHHVVSSDGLRYWTTGSGGGGTQVVFHGASAAMPVWTENASSLVIADGQLYASSATSIAPLGQGLPAEPGQQLGTPIVSLANGGGGTSEFEMVDRDPSVDGVDTMYAWMGSGIRKFTKGADGAWTRRGDFPIPAVVQHLTAVVDGDEVRLYVVPIGGAEIQRVTDVAAPQQDLTVPDGAVTIATAAPNTRFQGIAPAPVGDPGEEPVLPPTITVEPPATSRVLGAVGDPTNPGATITVADPDTAVEALTVTASSSNQGVLPASGLTVTGTGTQRTVSFAPSGRGDARVTLTVTDIDGNSAQATIDYTASGPVEEPTRRYHHLISDASSALDVGDGHMLLANDETNTLFLHRQGESGPPVKTFEFTQEQLGTGDEIDLEGVARSGDLLVWTGSHGNNRDGEVRTERRTMFATRITGSGAAVELSFAGRYTDLWTELIAWDRANGHGLGADALGFATGTQPGVQPNPPDGFNVEALEFAPDGTTGYLGFRAPTVGDDERALIVPVTNLVDLVDGAGTAGPARFGAPILLDLGGRSIRELRRNEHNEYLILAGPSPRTETWALYSWDGDPAHQPRFARQLPPEDFQTGGSWESIVSVPHPLEGSSTVQVVTDSGDTNFYGTGPTKDLGREYQKSYSQLFTMDAPPERPTIAVTESPIVGAVGDPTSPATTIVIGDPDTDVADLTVTAAAANPGILPAGSIAVEGTGAQRTVRFTPSGRGTTSVTFTVTDPEGGSRTASLQYAASAQIPDPSGRYYRSISDASSALDAGDGFTLLANDETNTLFLHRDGVSATPVRTFGFSGGQLGANDEIDLEGAARSGDLVVWTGSHGNNRSGEIRTERRTMFGTRITGSGADTGLAFAGRYNGLWNDLRAWDESGAHGRGANALGFVAGMAPGVLPNAPNGFNVEGLEFSPDGATGYVGFRAPTVPADGVYRALVVPVTNLADLVDGVGAAGPAQFGAPILLDLGGRSIRELRRNEHGEYLIIGGATPQNNSWALYTWDGDPAHDAVFNRDLPAEDFQTGGSWEALAAVPHPIVAGTPVRVTTDSGDSDFYGIGATKDIAQVYQKSYNQLFELAAIPPCPRPDSRSTVVLGGVDGGVSTGVPNRADSTGCTVNDLIVDVDEHAYNTSAEFVRHVTGVLDRLVLEAVLTARERSTILKTALRTPLR